MDFIYEAETLENLDTGNSSINLTSLSTSDLTKKLQSLSLLGRKSTNKNQPQKQQLHQISAQTYKRAKTSIDLLNSINFDINFEDDYIENGESVIENLNDLLQSKDSEYSIKQAIALLEKLLADPKYSVDSLSGIDQKSLVLRKNIRSLVEDELLATYSSQLKQFNKIAKSIADFHPKFSDTLKKYNELNKILKSSIDSSQDLKSKINNLNTEKNNVNLKKQLLINFKSNFTITSYDEHLLKFGDLNDSLVANDFFQAIEKVKKVQQNCEILLALKNQNLGLSILSKMNHFLAAANDRMINYIKQNIEQAYSGKSKNLNVRIFQNSLVYMYLNDKTDFDNILSDMIESRSKAVLNEFLTQLKGYSEEINDKNFKASLSISNDKSLYLSSYDTIKFISDTLAYIHSILVNEIESARSFLTFQYLEEDAQFENIIIDMVINIISSLNKTLKGSIENILRNETKPSIIISCYELIDLYCSMFTKLLYPNSIPNLNKNDKNLINTLNILLKESQERLFTVIKLKLKTLNADTLTNELETDLLPDWIVDWCAFVEDMFQTTSEENLINLNEVQWNELVKLVVKDPVDILMHQIKANKGLDNRDKLILKLNCVDYIYNKFNIINLLTNKCEYLEGLIQFDCNKLTEFEFTDLLKNSGLFDIYNLINMIFKLDDEFFDISFYQPIIENKLFNYETFHSANLKLELFFSEYINSNQLTNLMSPTLFNKVFFESSFQFVSFYEKLVKIVDEYLETPTENEKVFKWDAISIATLLGINEYYLENQNI